MFSHLARLICVHVDISQPHLTNFDGILVYYFFEAGLVGPKSPFFSGKNKKQNYFKIKEHIFGSIQLGVICSVCSVFFTCKCCCVEWVLEALRVGPQINIFVGL